MLICELCVLLSTFVETKLLQELAQYKQRLQKLDKDYCFTRSSAEGYYHSLAISGTEISTLNSDDIQNQMTSIWQKCKNLKIVIFLMNKLIELPKELMASQFMESITLICIQHNCFKRIPPKLHEFKQMEHLNMHGNELSYIPEEIKSLTKLTRLYLGDNNLHCLPDVFDHFPHLKKASFKQNSLVHLPPSFSTLHQLENLDISDNALLNIPVALLELESLKVLNVERNRIQKISPSNEEDCDIYSSTCSLLRQIEIFLIKGNPLWDHTCRIMQVKETLTDQDILEGLRKKEIFDRITKLCLSRSLRVNVLGESGAGKTSVVEAFSLGKYVIPTSVYPHRHTVGIERHYMPVEVNGRIIELHIWDHAGDNEYAMMNDLFISNRNLVWLVVNLFTYEKDIESYNKNVRKWLFQVMLHNTEPVIWIVGTHADHIDNAREKMDDIKLKTEELKKFISRLKYEEYNEEEGSKFSSYLFDHLKYFALSNTHEFSGYENIKDSLQNLESEFPKLTDNLPHQWKEAMHIISLHTEKFNSLKTSKTPTITIKELRSLDGLRDLSKPSFCDLITYLHEIGEIYLLHPPSHITNDQNFLASDNIIVLNPDWIIDLFKVLYRHDFKEYVTSIIPGIENKVYERRERFGLIPKDLLKDLWSCDNDVLFGKIIDIFAKYNLTYCDDSETAEYLFPYLNSKDYMMKHPRTPRISSPKARIKFTIRLKIETSFFFPKFILQRLAVKLFHDKHWIDMLTDGFRARYKTDGGLVLVRFANEPSQTEVMKVSASSYDTKCSTDYLWMSIFNSLKLSQDLFKYWVFGKITYGTLCPNCLEKDNYLPIMHFNDSLYHELRRQELLKCKFCQKKVSINVMVPPQSYMKDLNETISTVNNDSDLHELWLSDNWELSPITEETEFDNESTASESSYQSSATFFEPVRNS